MKRWMFNITAVLSLLLMVATFPFWMDSLFSNRTVGWSTASKTYACGHLAGQFELRFVTSDLADWSPGFFALNYSMDGVEIDPDDYDWFSLGLGARGTQLRISHRVIQLHV